jgi:hypothetical protein
VCVGQPTSLPSGRVSIELPTFVPVGQGMLALTHRPKKKPLPLWADAGVSHVVTLLSESEGALSVGETVQPRSERGFAWSPPTASASIALPGHRHCWRFGISR